MENRSRIYLCSALCVERERIDNPFGRRLHLVVRERPLRIPERQTQRQADAAFGNAFALIAIEFDDR